MKSASTRPILVVGAGIAGLTAALEAAEAGNQVVLIDSAPTLGGRVVRNHHYFPKLCPPTCGMEINAARLQRNPRIRFIPDAEATAATRSGETWRVTITRAPEYVLPSCTACDDCTPACPVKVPSDFDLGASEVAAIHLPSPSASPRRYHIERAACPEGCSACAEACPVDAIDLAATATEEVLEVGSVVLATGWRPYPLEELTELGGGVLANVIANVNMERLASASGPTGGHIQRPSDGQPPAKVAFVQCAGSRDVKHLSYCSAVCCLASLKQAIYVREELPDAEVTIYYIDRRAPGRNEEFLTRVSELDGVRLVKGKVAKVEAADGDRMRLFVEDVEAGTLLEDEADLVVLATGMVPALDPQTSPFGIQVDPDGFGLDDESRGLFVAGCVRRPEDVAASVRDATGSAAKAVVAARFEVPDTAVPAASCAESIAR